MADNTAEGVQIAGALTAAERKAEAFDALHHTFGAIAGDPERAQQLEDLSFSQQAHPLELEGKRLSNAGASQTYDFNALANPKTLAGKDLANEGAALHNAGTSQTNEYNALANPLDLAQKRAATAQTEQTTATAAAKLPGELAAQQANIAQSRAATAASQQTTGTARALQERQAAMGMVSALSDVATQGGDIGAAFDRLAPVIAKMENVDPTHLQQLRAAIVADPEAALGQLSSAITAAGAVTGKGAAGAANSPQARAGQVSALQVTQERTKAVPDSVKAAAALLPQMSGSAIIRKARALLPGSPEYNFEAALKQITTNLSLDDLRSLRTSGLSLGRVTNAEFTAASNAFANMDLGQDPRTLATSLIRLGETYKHINSNLDDDIARLSKGIPGKSAAKKDTPQFQEGQVYKDSSGNRAKYVGGKWVEVK